MATVPHMVNNDFLWILSCPHLFRMWHFMSFVPFLEMSCPYFSKDCLSNFATSFSVILLRNSFAPYPLEVGIPQNSDTEPLLIIYTLLGNVPFYLGISTSTYRLQASKLPLVQTALLSFRLIHSTAKEHLRLGSTCSK